MASIVAMDVLSAVDGVESVAFDVDEGILTEEEIAALLPSEKETGDGVETAEAGSEKVAVEGTQGGKVATQDSSGGGDGDVAALTGALERSGVHDGEQSPEGGG